jgi:uncharacterized membrane protein YccF (DUF307 family)
MSAVMRALWFVFIGWWFGPLWFLMCLFLMGTIVFFPIGAYAVTKTWAVTTFKTSPTVVIEDARSEGDAETH